MTARTWAEGDRMPKDHPPLVDDEGVTWLWVEDDEDWWEYRRQYFEVRGGLATGGPMYMEWEDILVLYGPMREATDEESDHLTIVYKNSRTDSSE